MLDKLDRIFESLSQIRETQARHDENLKEHMRRTEASEARVELVESFLETEIKPRLHFVTIAIKVGVGIVGLLGAAKLSIELLQILG